MAASLGQEAYATRRHKTATRRHEADVSKKASQEGFLAQGHSLFCASSRPSNRRVCSHSQTATNRIFCFTHNDGMSAVS